MYIYLVTISLFVVKISSLYSCKMSCVECLTGGENIDVVSKACAICQKCRDHRQAKAKQFPFSQSNSVQNNYNTYRTPPPQANQHDQANYVQPKIQQSNSLQFKQNQNNPNQLYQTTQSNVYQVYTTRAQYQPKNEILRDEYPTTETPCDVPPPCPYDYDSTPAQPHYETPCPTPAPCPYDYTTPYYTSPVCPPVTGCRPRCPPVTGCRPRCPPVTGCRPNPLNAGRRTPPTSAIFVGVPKRLIKKISRQIRDFD